MQWVMTSHVRRHLGRRGTSGHVWQGRFKVFPIQQDEHLLTVLAYVERNPRRAKLGGRAEDWGWSSLAAWRSKVRPAFLVEGPVDRPRGWIAAVNRDDDPASLARMRECVNRGAPLGSEEWSRRIAARLGLEAALQPRGRPRKNPKVPTISRK